MWFLGGKPPFEGYPYFGAYSLVLANESRFLFAYPKKLEPPRHLEAPIPNPPPEKSTSSQSLRAHVRSHPNIGFQ